jgi:hypothetical protein
VERLNRIIVGSFGIQAESYSVDWVGWVAVGSLFSSNTIWPELPNESSKVTRKAKIESVKWNLWWTKLQGW